MYRDRTESKQQCDISPSGLSPSGYGIHWPELDEDLLIDGLLRAGGIAKCKEHSAKNKEHDRVERSVNPSFR